MKEKLSREDVEVETVVRYGHVAETLSTLAEEYKVTQIIIGRTGESGLQKRLFGSVSVILAQIAPVPCTIVP